MPDPLNLILFETNRTTALQPIMYPKRALWILPSCMGKVHLDMFPGSTLYNIPYVHILEDEFIELTKAGESMDAQNLGPPCDTGPEVKSAVCKPSRCDFLSIAKTSIYKIVPTLVMVSHIRARSWLLQIFDQVANVPILILQTSHTILTRSVYHLF